MLQRIPDRIDPWHLAEQEETLEGRIRLDSLPRLSPLLANANGEAAFVLSFAKDRQRRVIVTLALSAELILECQRCLGNMTQNINGKTHFALVSGLLEAEQLPQDLDPLLIESGRFLDLIELIEDELLLGIPSSPRHEEQTCNRDLNDHDNPLPENESKEDNPFAVLAGLRTGKDDN